MPEMMFHAFQAAGRWCYGARYGRLYLLLHP
jgi:hypothetical protein